MMLNYRRHTMTGNKKSHGNSAGPCLFPADAVCMVRKHSIDEIQYRRNNYYRSCSLVAKNLRKANKTVIFHIRVFAPNTFSSPGSITFRRSVSHVLQEEDPLIA